MYEFIDNSMLYLIEGLGNTISELFGSFIGISTVLAGTFALIFLGIESYKMMMGETELRVNTILRPFLIGLVIMLWVPFLGVIDAPCNALTQAGKEIFENQIQTVNQLQRTRAAIADSITMKIVKQSAESEEAEALSTDEEVHRLGIRLDGIVDKIQNLGIYVVGKIRQILFSFFETIIITIWQAIVYLIMFLGMIFFKSILAIVGPLAFAFSLLPSWRDAWSTWVSKYISVSLYGFIAYIDLAVSMAIIQYGIEDDIDVLTQANLEDEAFTLFTCFASGFHNNFIPALIVSAISLLLIPKVAEWIVPSSGTSQAASSSKRNVAAGAKAVAAAIA
jgi:hypothetical protein